MHEYSAWLAEAMALAASARGQVEPNPLVGAIVLENGQVVGRGWHQVYGGDHAEVVALREAGGRGDTLVVTLEPCSTAGKTPACVEALKQSSLKKIVVGATDPHPEHQGKGLELLRAAGKEVIEVDFQKEWEEQNRSFLQHLDRSRPWVIAKWAMTLDGKIAAPGGDAHWVSSEASREDVWRLRGRCEAVVAGVGTVLADDPLLTPREHDALSEPPRRVVFDSTLRTPPAAKILTEPGGRALFFTGNRKDAARRAALESAGGRVVELSGARPGVRQALETLHAEGVRRVLLEAGPELNASFLKEECLDQVVVYLAPKITGGRKAPSPLGGEGMEKMADSLPIQELSCIPCGPDFKLVGFL